MSVDIVTFGCRLNAYESEAIRARGIREGVRITRGGQTSFAPRFVARGAWEGAAGDLVYFRDDGHDTGERGRAHARLRPNCPLTAPSRANARTARPAAPFYAACGWKISLRATSSPGTSSTENLAPSTRAPAW